MNDEQLYMLEIERTYLLDALPELPASTVSLRMEQGYFGGRPDYVLKGRIRRTTHADGSVICTHTIKRGIGLVRSELERTITEQEFLLHWPATAGRRLTKTRHMVASGGYVWEVDHIDELDLVLAEVELPKPDALVRIPTWLESHIVREVTDEKQFTNHQLAIRLAAEQASRTGQ